MYTFFLFMNMTFKMSRKINIWKLYILKILEDKESNGLHKNLQNVSSTS